jgi:site-specific DNA-adenine methylase
MKYGLPYRGSKSRIAADIVEHLPSGAALYDLFAGGCAVTHAAMVAGRWDRYVINDIQGDMPELFVNAISGKYRNENRWISRDDFVALKDTDAYVRCCWSFGNDTKTYLYGREMEPYKRALHYAVVFDDFEPLGELCPEVCGACRWVLSDIDDRSERRVAIGRAITSWLKAHGTREMIMNNPLYKSCHFKGGRKEGLESLQRLESLERYAADYREIPITKDATVYCDPPYKSANGYCTGTFDHDAFHEWARNADFPIYISEYSMPDDFVRIWARDVNVLANQFGADGNVTEGLFVHRKWMNDIWKPTLF